MNEHQLGERLRRARERVGLTQQSVGERTRLGNSSLSEFENGKREPSISQLQELARCYHVSLADLLREESDSVDVVLWRKKPEKATELEAEFLRLCHQYRNLERWCSVEMAAALPLPMASRRRAETLSYRDAEELAREARKALSLGDRPARTLLSVLEEECRLKVFHLPFEPTGTAACSKSQGFGEAILLNAKNSRRRRNFDLAHELFHLVTWERFEHKDGTSDAQEEKLADAFASCLLMPTEVIETSVHQRIRDHKLSLRALCDIARDLDVSVEALLWRIKRIFGRSEAQTRKSIEVSKRYAEALQDRSDPIPPTRPTRFRDLAVAALLSGDLSVGRCAEYLGVSRKEAQELILQGDATDEAIELPSA